MAKKLSKMDSEILSARKTSPKIQAKYVSCHKVYSRILIKYQKRVLFKAISVDFKILAKFRKKLREIGERDIFQEF